MDLKDLFLTPFFLAIFYGLAFAFRGRFTNVYTKKYFIPALSVKFLGAISLGLIYQFYYNGGDTFNYYNHVKVVHEALTEAPGLGLQILTSHGDFNPATQKYTSQLHWYRSSTEFFVVKIASVFSVFCFNTYSVIALCFAIFSFAGVWAMYTTFLRIFPAAYKKLAIACFFLPSVFFWGSGLMKDSLCLGALGWAFYGFYHLFIEKKYIVKSSILLLLGVYILVSTKVYILLSFMPPALFWVFNENNSRIKSASVRLLLKPVFIAVGLAAGYYGATNLTAGDERFDVDKIGERSKITQEYLSKYVASGSAYDIGQLDGSLGSIVRVAPQAIFISLFRPFLFEARNPVMVLSALEATLFLYLTLSLFYRTGFFKGLGLIAATPVLNFCFLFSIIMAIGVGTTSGNFGTLVRYKIPLMPFFLAALYVMQFKAREMQRLNTLKK